MTSNQIKAELSARGIEFPENAKKPELELLLAQAPEDSPGAPEEPIPAKEAPEEPSLQLLNLIAGGMTVSEAREELAKRKANAPGNPIVESHVSREDLKGELKRLKIDFHPTESRERLAARLAEALDKIEA